MITEINKDNFEKEVLRSEKPVVADFWAPWCGYCRRLAPAIDRLESEYGDKLITLSTCEYSRKNGRMVVVAKRIAAPSAEVGSDA